MAFYLYHDNDIKIGFPEKVIHYCHKSSNEIQSKM